MRPSQYLRALLLLLPAICSLQTLAADHYRFRVYLKDKGRLSSSPQQFLSPAAIERRARYGIAIDESDYPVSPLYLDSLRSCGASVVTVGKWLGTALVEAADSSVASAIGRLSFVKEVRWVWKGEHAPAQAARPRDTAMIGPSAAPLPGSVYGYADRQISMLNGKALHEKGFRGKGITIAVIDAGFNNADRMEAFRHTGVAAAFNVVSPAESVFADDEHGVKVLSCMAANLPGIIVGSAPEASYLLIKSEDVRSEFPVEEDYWLAAAELADSAGAHVISSSVGYGLFDCEELSYSASMLDGRSTLVSLAAGKAAGKGMLVLVCSGNEAGGDWGSLSFPADARDVIAVGGVTESKERASFSAWGATTDGRIKPDVVALGVNCAVMNSSGDLSLSSGTSFAAPVVAGLGACLWQALPHLTAREIARLIISSSSSFASPDSMTGYGLPDFAKALNDSQYDGRAQ
ncbi:MAG: S8 family serine peptidase [Tannerellaceae bacterium]|nr:S8 family serine peptidase [Tannerellaceae bacterium]